MPPSARSRSTRYVPRSVRPVKSTWKREGTSSPGVVPPVVIAGSLPGRRGPRSEEGEDRGAVAGGALGTDVGDRREVLDGLGRALGDRLEPGVREDDDVRDAAARGFLRAPAAQALLALARAVDPRGLGRGAPHARRRGGRL